MEKKHFLLCDIESCRKISEKCWKKLQERNQVVNLIPAEDLEDIDSEFIEIDVDDYDNKLALSDEIDMTQNCIPTLNIKNSDNTPITHNFLKTYFELEKIKTIVPYSDKTAPFLVLFDGGSGTTMGNHLEELDGFETQQTKNIILSTLNGVDRAQKRVCKVTLVDNNDDKIPLEVVVPSELIHKPGAQSMEDFQKHQKHRAKTNWVDPVSKEDIDNLPLILLGLNYRKYFPQPVPDKYFTKNFREQHPDIVFSKSKFTDKTMATGIRESDLVNIIHYHEYKGDEEDFTHLPVKVEFSPLDRPEHTINLHLQEVDLSNLSEVEK